MFHVSHLRNCVHDLTTMVEPSQLEDVELVTELSSSCRLARIMVYSVKQLRKKVVKLVKVRYGNDPVEST